MMTPYRKVTFDERKKETKTAYLGVRQNAEGLIELAVQCNHTQLALPVGLSIGRCLLPQPRADYESWTAA
jgi:hypothetical protein